MRPRTCLRRLRPPHIFLGGVLFYELSNPQHVVSQLRDAPSNHNRCLLRCGENLLFWLMGEDENSQHIWIQTEKMTDYITRTKSTMDEVDALFLD